VDAVIEEIAISSPLGPEQRAQLACRGGEENAHRAILLAHVGLDASVEPPQLRAALEQVVQQHEILGAAIGREPGFRGLRLRSGARTAALSWREAGSVPQAEAVALEPLDLQGGELLRAVFAVAEDGGARLLLAISALVADNGSLAALVEQMADCLRGSGVREVFQYGQYLQWRAELEADVDAGAGHNYWEHYLQNIEALAAPRLAYRRQCKPGGKHRCLRRQLDAAVLARVDGLAERVGTTAEVLLQTAWWLLLARLTGCNRFAAGWQHDCRQDYDLMQGAVGVFEKILPLAIEGGNDESFAVWLKRMAARTADHIEAQEYWPPDSPVAGEQLAVGFAYRDAPRLAANSALRTVELPGPAPAFELLLAVEASADCIGLCLYADSALYPPLAIERLLEQYATLLQAALETPHGPAADLPWMGEAEWRALRAGWSGREMDLGPRSLGGHIARWARRNPKAPAVVCGETCLSYRALDTRASQLAHWMRAQGVEQGALVALELPRSTDLVAAMLATWRIGAAYLPLEPGWPRARREEVLADARPALVVSAVPAQLDTFPDGPPGHRPRPEDPAYVLYTSGSTGRPKGVLIGQRQLLNYVAAASAGMGLAACRRWGLMTSPTTDLGNTALFGALFNGACLVLASEEEARDAAAFACFVARHQIDALKMVPSHLAALLEYDTPRLPDTLVLGGEAAPRDLIERLFQLAPDCTVYNHYGPTETTVGVMVHRADPGEPVPPSLNESLPLSRVLANNRVYLLDEQLRPVPTGAQGEVYIGGAQLCLGYLGHGYLNATGDDRVDGSAFVKDPWQPGQWLYRSGDLAWALPQGLRLAGRADHQVKIRGYRVEPAEVEAALLGLPGVRQAAVIARTVAGTAELVAFVVADKKEDAQPPWREQLAGRLPSHMLPAEVIVADTLPRLSSGKIDRRALADRATGPQETSARTLSAQAGGAEPATALEAALGGFMAELLGREQLAADADFFESGGHSLLVIRLVARIRKVFRIEVEPGLVFDHATPQALARVLCGAGDAAALEQLAVAQGAQT